MTKGLPRSSSRGSTQQQEIIKEVVKITNQAITVTGGASTAAGFGTVVIGGLPEGNILFLGATGYVDFDGSGSDANLIATWDGDYSVGTTPTADATLSGTDANIIGSTATGAAVAEQGVRARGTGVTAAIFDNTDGSLELNLNLITDDNSVTDSLTSVITANGEIQLVYVLLGDD